MGRQPITGPDLDDPRSARQFELKDRAPARGRRYPDSTAVALNDRAADRKSHSHAAGLGGEQPFEDPATVGLADAYSAVLDRQMDHPGHGLTGSNAQHPMLYRAHRVHGIHDKVENDLLELDRIADDGRKRPVELRFDAHALGLQIHTHDRENGADEVIDV